MDAEDKSMLENMAVEGDIYSGKRLDEREQESLSVNRKKKKKDVYRNYGKIKKDSYFQNDIVCSFFRAGSLFFRLP